MHTKRYHIIIDLKQVSDKILNNKSGLEKFLRRLVRKIGMHILYEPVVVSGIEENPGISGFTLIDFSHISIHTFTNYNEALVDIFSCKSYDKKVAKTETLKYFKISKDQARIQIVYWG